MNDHDRRSTTERDPSQSKRSTAEATWRIGTRVVHAGQEPDAATGAVAPAIYPSSTFVQDGVGQLRGGYEYARTGNPTRSRLEHSIAALESASFGLAFASGSAATQAVASLVQPPEEIVCSNDVYGGTYRFFERVLRPTGIHARYVDLSDDPEDALATALTDRTRLVWLETPSNPLLKLVDIRAVATRLSAHVGARGERPLLAVDNTFASPLGQQPLALGADLVSHSATKYLAGHSDVVNGLVVTSSPQLHQQLAFFQNAVGAVPSPFDCFLVLRGIRTLKLRIERHTANAQRVAEALATRDDVAHVRYPGLSSGPHAHPQAALAQEQMAFSGGMISFETTARDGRSAETRARRFCELTRLFTLAESLGGVESLVELPAAMTHGAVADSTLAVPPALVRLSVGIEDADDLVADVIAALDEA